MSVRIKRFATAVEAAEACGAEIFRLLDAARVARGSATLAVSGGSTPRIMFEWMAKQTFDWNAIDLFWVDERCVPADDAQSNYRMTRESLLDHAPLAVTQIHRVKTELIPDEAAEAYIDDISHVFRLKPGELPAFDVLQRGMGPDRHTASLFPGEPLIQNRTGIAAAVWVEKMRQHRVTLLPGVLEKARHTLCLVTGPDKAEGLREVLSGPGDPLHIPSKISSAEMDWFVDLAAAARLE
ncbi:MAG TPA: 6-phosphogluconolactonase [Bryobacteraceae bacterium]|nr:6-phosphogluconolactonase [Bryobacteraceae bacterium]